MSLWYDQINTKWKGNGIHLWCLNLYIPKICSLWGCWGLDTTERLHFHFSLSCIGEGNGNPLQCSCLENPRDRGAWCAAVYGVTQSWTRLKWLSNSSSSSRIDDPEERGRSHNIWSILKVMLFIFSFLLVTVSPAWGRRELYNPMDTRCYGSLRAIWLSHIKWDKAHKALRIMLGMSYVPSKH